MTAINILDLYERFGNFFEVDLRAGPVYLVEQDNGSPFDRRTMISFAGKVFSCEPRKDSVEFSEPSLEIFQRFVSNQFEINLIDKGYKLRKWGYCAHKPNEPVPQPHQDIFSLFKGFVYRFRTIEEKITLCIDPHLVLQTNSSIHYLIQKGIPVAELNDFSVRYDTEDQSGISGYLLSSNEVSPGEVYCKIKRFRNVGSKIQEETVNADKVFPESRPELLQKFVDKQGSHYSIIDLQRKMSFLDSKTASRDRFMSTLDIVTTLSQEIFPLKFGNSIAGIKTQPIVIKL
jgi:hypothetical protein